ncbi:hypothetical protein ACFSTA_01495 [Ornithinibacillus salinisoli]|uniref:Uncharacterized protein n=1 Tax=Ornithinibacillus salinisoli TaxID=1848459 RepID=A0ABW4VTE0_9BACI
MPISASDFQPLFYQELRSFAEKNAIAVDLTKDYEVLLLMDRNKERRENEGGNSFGDI